MILYLRSQEQNHFQTFNYTLKRCRHPYRVILESRVLRCNPQSDKTDRAGAVDQRLYHR